MSTQYIDLNASNAVEINDSNNRYKIKLNEGLELPTGTEISVQNSLINLQGITGQSIELEKDFEETICFNYYLVDTSMEAPVLSIGTPTTVTDYNIFADLRFDLNGDIAFGSNANLNDRTQNNVFGAAGAFQGGYSETIMPLCGVLNKDGNPENFLVPLCGKAKIKIPKGVYSVESLGDLITDQINRVKIPESDNLNLTNDEYQREKQQNKGLLCNNTTTRPIQANKNVDLVAYAAGLGTSPMSHNRLPGFRAMTPDDNETVSSYAIRPEHMFDLFFQAKTHSYDYTNNPDTAQEDKCFKGAAPTNARYGYTLKQTNGEDEFLNYNLFAECGWQVGTTNLKISYSASESGFSISHLHEPRRIPTNDKRGDAMSNPSQECVYSKRVVPVIPSNYAQPTGFQPYAALLAAGHFDDAVLLKRTLSAYVQRTSGIMIYNWGLETCESLGDVDKLDEPGYTVSDGQKDFWEFEDFFSTKEKAKKAWEKTLWFRMGFSYEQLQSPDASEKQVIAGEVQDTIGITTRAQIDQSAIPFISSLYNDYSVAAETKPSGDQWQGLPAVGVVQVFTGCDVNIPGPKYNNNKKLNPTADPACVYPYQGSFYNGAVMIPFQTSGLDIIARNLPRLSVNGYMLVLSDIINQNDQAGKQSEVGILDMIPKSSLSNQDFISDRNMLVHTLSNPKSINYVNVNIVNPDLTDLDLETNSTLLLKITKPMARPTELMARAQINYAENEISQEEVKEIQQQQIDQQKAGKK